MATPAPGRRLAHAVVAFAFAGPAVLLGGVAWADPTPDPAAPADTSTAPDGPVVQPSIGTWIIGGTLLEGTAAQPAKPVAKPAAKPVAKPAAKPVAKPAAVAPARAVTSVTSQSTRTAPPAALPFTGGHVDALLPTGITLLVGGLVLTLGGRPRRVTA